jgi:hypothetical protein
MRPTCLRAAVVFVVAGPVSFQAFASMPDDQQVVYHIRESPTDPESAVVFDVVLHLSAEAVDGNTVGWRVYRLEIRQDLAETVMIWAEADPYVGTPDGLWWIEHVDRDAPDLAEFAETPPLEGMAANETPELEALAYRISGTPPANPNSPFLYTTGLTFALTVEGENEPFTEGENEPAEVDRNAIIRA